MLVVEVVVEAAAGWVVRLGLQASVSEAARSLVEVETFALVGLFGGWLGRSGV